MAVTRSEHAAGITRTVDLVGTQPPTRAWVLVVMDRIAATPALLRAVHDRARRSPVHFVVLVPKPAPAEWHPFHPERRDKLDEAERLLLRALPAIQDAADDAVRGRMSVRHDAMAAIEETLRDEPFDEIMLSVAPHGLERRLHVDLAHRVAHLGLPVTVIIESPPPAS
jgi:hypothetical protein